MIKQKKWAQTRKKQTNSLISQNTMQLNYCLFFFIREFSSLDVRSQVISPPETATLSTSFESYIWKTISQKHQSGYISFDNRTVTKKKEEDSSK
jgi:hypothetical protein